MHPVLTSTYLLKEIFEHLGADNNKECCHAALVCRSFQNPAQDVLWRKLDSIRPLLELLHNFQFEDPSETWIVGSDISVLELEALQKFGRRVRYLSFCLGHSGEGAITLHPSVPIMLANALAGRPLLPNLQHLSFSVNYMRGNYPCTGLLHVLHSTNIRTVRLWHDIDDEDAVIGFHNFSSFISRLSQAPLLHELELIDFLPSEATQQAFKSFQSLSILNISLPPFHSFPFTLFSSFTELQHLQSLSIHELNFDEFVLDQKHKKVELTALRSFSVSCTFHMASKLVRIVKAPALQEFDFELEFDDQENNLQYPWPELFKAMLASFGPQFSRLHIYKHDNSLGLERNIVDSYIGVPFNHVSHHLLQMRLKELRLLFPIVESVSMADLDQMFKAWPTLTTLNLWTSSRVTAPDTSVLSLVAQGLPHLIHLQLPIDATVITDPPQTASYHRLETISLQPINWVGNLQHIRKFALLLDSIFPDIQLISVVDGYGTCHPLNEIRQQIVSLQAARQMERLRILQLPCQTLENTNERIADADKMEG